MTAREGWSRPGSACAVFAGPGGGDGGEFGGELGELFAEIVELASRGRMLGGGALGLGAGGRQAIIEAVEHVIDF